MNHSITRTNYNRLSRLYDLFAGGEKQFTGIGLGLLNAQSGEKVLEIGFGTGHALLALANSVGENGKVFGIDLSEGMFGIAQAKIDRYGLSNRIQIRLGDALNLPFEDEFFNAFFLSFTLEIFDSIEIPRVLAECKRVLEKNGRLGVVALQKKECRSVFIYEWLHTRLPAIVDCRPLFVPEIIMAGGFFVTQSVEKSMWGLPVTIILARKI